MEERMREGGRVRLGRSWRVEEEERGRKNGGRTDGRRMKITEGESSS